ncbi:MAG: hypothetical protein KIT58_20620 [Planctomycetota bacterium]|nr:hypothetical protein [Planctomycetota bacterium]
MARPPIDPSGPLLTVTARLPAPHVELLDLLALAFGQGEGRAVSRGEALRRLVGPLFRALEEEREMQEAIRRSQRESLARVRALPLDPPGRKQRRRPPPALRRAADQLDALAGRPGVGRSRSRGKGGKRPSS